MILKENLSKLVHTTGDNLNGIGYSIDAENMGMAIKAFYQYADVISSIVREVTSNCIDAHEEAKIIPGSTDEQLRQLGYKEDNLLELRKYFSSWRDQNVRITIREANALQKGTRQIEFEDFGVGLSPDRINDVFTKFFSSTKRRSNSYIGAFGLGSKSPLGYCDLFMISTIYFGQQYTYAVHVGSAAPELKLISQNDTDESNGTVFTVPIKDDRDLESFQRAVQKQLMYFDGLTIEGVPNYDEGAIIRGQNFIFRENSKENLHICLGKVYYPLDFSHFLNLGGKNSLPVGLYFEVGDLDVVPNRESIEYTAETIDAVNAKVELLGIELQKIWDDNHSDLDTIEKLLTASGQIQDCSLLIGLVEMPNINTWISRKVFYSQRPKMGRFKNDYFLDAMVNIDRIVKEGKTKQSSLWGKFNWDENTVYIWDDAQKSQPSVNRYIHEALGFDSFYLASWKDFEDAARVLVSYSLDVEPYGTNRFCRFDDYPDHIQREWIEFMKEIKNYLEVKTHIYNSSIVPQKWLDVLKENRKTLAKEKKEAKAKGIADGTIEKIPIMTEMPYKHLESWHNYSYLQHSWSMDTVFFKNLNHGSLGQWIDNNLPIIYGCKEERKEMEQLHGFLIGSNRINIGYIRSSHARYDKLINGQPLFVQVSKPNRKLMTKIPTAFSLVEYKSRLTNFISKVKTSALISDAVDKLVDPGYTEMRLIPEYEELYRLLNEYVSRYNCHSGGVFYTSRKDESNLDQDIIVILKRTVAMAQKYPLLEFISSDAMRSDDAQSELDKYLNEKGEVNPDLYMRLREFQKKTAKALEADAKSTTIGDVVDSIISSKINDEN